MCIQFAYKRPQKISSHSLTSATKRSNFGKAKPIPMKYAVLFIALLFAGCDEGSSTVGYEIKIDGSAIQVAKEDFPNEMDWHEAMAECETLGNGWRLPSKEELREVYSQLYQQGKGNFKNEPYWSSSEFDANFACSFRFELGVSYEYNKYTTKHVRAVRTLP